MASQRHAAVKIEDSPEPQKPTHHVENNDIHEPLHMLPAPLELLIPATRYVEAAHRLTPVIARGHTSQEDQSCSSNGEGYQHNASDATAHTDASSTHSTFISLYRRYMTAALGACSSAVNLGGPDVRLNMQARLMLAQLLATETRNTERAEEVIARALALASTHDSLIEYRFQLLYLQVNLSLSAGKIKFAKNITKKAAVELFHNRPTLKPWLYRFQLLFLRICDAYEHDYPSALAIIGDMEKQANDRDHTHFAWVLTTMKARLAILTGDSTTAGTILFALAKDFKLPIADSDVTDPKAKLKDFQIQHVNPLMRTLPTPFLLQFLILLSIHQTHTGHAVAARQNIRRAQFYLDQKGSSDDSIGKAGTGATLSVPIALEDGTILSQTLTLSTLPRAVIYAYTFLISTIVQLDPIGRQPKCLHFATAGLERLTQMLDFGEGLPSDEAEEDTEYAFGALKSIPDTVKRLAGINIDLLLIQGDLLLMRSNLPEVHTIIVDLVTLARSYDLWDTYRSRIIILQGMFLGFMGDLEQAFDCYAMALQWTEPSSHIGVVARASLLFVRLAQGFRVRLSSNEGYSRSPSPTKTTFERSSRSPSVKREFSAEPETDEDLEGFAKQILRDCDQDVPSLKILGLVIESIVNGEISRAKRNLSLALQISSDIENQHMKPIILALLACQFTYTRDDQAFRMLHSAHAICGSLGGADKYKDKQKKIKSEEADDTREAGLAKIGLWLGERLLETYELDKLESKVVRQREHNERYRRALAAQDDLFRLVDGPGSNFDDSTSERVFF